MFNTALFHPQNILVIGLIALSAVLLMEHFESKPEGSK